MANLNQNFTTQAGRSGLAQRRQRVGAVGAVENDFAKCRRVGECAELPVAADRLLPLLTGVAFGGAESPS
jgi:hypothetical protein